MIVIGFLGNFFAAIAGLRVDNTKATTIPIRIK
jgi:hypothetical protein